MREEIMGRARLILGDCREVLGNMGSFDAILTDPPYGMKYRSGHNSGRSGIGAEMVRKDGNFAPIEGDQQAFDPAFLLALQLPTILWGANHYNDKLPADTRWLIWDKLAGKATLPSGSDVELAWTSERGPDKMFTHLWRGIMRAGEENVSRSPKQHPNQKPVALMTWCLQFIATAETIVDPFMGSGSSGVAALRAGRSFVGIESDRTHFETACRRIREAAFDGPLFVDAA